MHVVRIRKSSNEYRILIRKSTVRLTLRWTLGREDVTWVQLAENVKSQVLVLVVLVPPY